LLNSVRSALLNNNFVKKGKIKNNTSKEFNIIGKSSPITDIKNMIDKVSLTNAKVLIQGPNGSGKELVAHQIHLNSLRNSAPFIEVNCAAIPSELIESELFGHVKGAFTSAVKDKAGKFEAANGGTIFLDEIGDMSMPAQSKVLRALQEHKIQRVGSERDLVVDVRVIAATNKNLRKEIENNNFREDLFHRLAVIEIDVPSLNKRLSDIPLLVEHFLKDIAKDSENELKTMDKDAINQLKEYDWSGNVRELRNVVERLIILSDNNKITKKDVIKYSNK
jgi:DNA-binding NtrC family response regulator